MNHSDVIDAATRQLIVAHHSLNSADDYHVFSSHCIDDGDDMGIVFVQIRQSERLASVSWRWVYGHDTESYHFHNGLYDCSILEHLERA